MDRSRFGEVPLKKIFLVCTLNVLIFAMLGCSVEKTNKTTANPTTNQATNKELTIDEALAKAINNFNLTVKDNSDNDFPQKIKAGETISENIKIGGVKENTTKLDISVKVKKDGNKYTVTLTKDYNITVDGTKAISIWKYEISNNEVKLLDKSENGNLVRIIK
jgi:hypothetical protein